MTPDIVLDSTISNLEKNNSDHFWFLMRVSYGREKIAKSELEEKGIKVFLPTIVRIRNVGGKRKRCIESLISNFLFVYSSEQELNKYVGRPPLEFLHYYYVPNKDLKGNAIGFRGVKPLIIPNDQMDRFILWNKVEDDNKMFFADKTFDEGDYVKITGGKFAGITGFVCRVKHQSRVGVHIEGLGTVVTAYIPKSFLQSIDSIKV